MEIFSRNNSLLIVTLGLVTCLGCHRGISIGHPGGSNLYGVVSIEGSSTVEPISRRAREKFNELHPNVNLLSSGKGTGNGLVALSRKEVDIAKTSRPITWQEAEACRLSGVQFFEIPIAYDGLTIVVNRANEFVDALTLEQLVQIFRQDRAARLWSDIDPTWPHEPIVVYAAGIASGTHDYFVEMISQQSGYRLRSDEQITLSEDDRVLIRGIKEDPYAIGFFGFAYYQPERENLRAVRIENPYGVAIEPTAESISSGEYTPFSRPLFIYVNAESFRRWEVKEFVKFWLEHASQIALDAGSVPLPEEIYDLSKQRLESGSSDQVGTHFLDLEGKSRKGSLFEIYKSHYLHGTGGDQPTSENSREPDFDYLEN
ncbi:MAG TPA: PstS family phosphate ABC transporter substrate-binding protein [Pirellulaceae bacterium]|nr:PstS family phosphate ABC transporter substrate-binding protein [Pirellulaceae bacterium]HMO92033.1 PstS family phosphate ABC transporter substrate-binding protein [Pirellulaceae bacterium]HMP68832.1 PstS family phosphate ABC transporter substrate-binding protein [Pirellulaceae bacterium]